MLSFCLKLKLLAENTSAEFEQANKKVKSMEH